MSAFENWSPTGKKLAMANSTEHFMGEYLYSICEVTTEFIWRPPPNRHYLRRWNWLHRRFGRWREIYSWDYAKLERRGSWLGPIQLAEVEQK